MIGVAIVPFGLMMRRSLPETIHAPDRARSEPVPVRPYLLVAVLGGMMLASGTIWHVRQSVYARHTRSRRSYMRANIAFAAIVVTGICNVAIAP